jgi:hypothetical protein
MNTATSYNTTTFTTNTPAVNRPDLNGTTDYWKVGYDNTLPTSGTSRATYGHGATSPREAAKLYAERADAEAMAYHAYMNGQACYAEYENASLYREDAFNAYMAALRVSYNV